MKEKVFQKMGLIKRHELHFGAKSPVLFDALRKEIHPVRVPFFSLFVRNEKKFHGIAADNQLQFRFKPRYLGLGRRGQVKIELAEDRLLISLRTYNFFLLIWSMIALIFFTLLFMGIVRHQQDFGMELFLFLALFVGFFVLPVGYVFFSLKYLEKQVLKEINELEGQISASN